MPRIRPMSAAERVARPESIRAVAPAPRARPSRQTAEPVLLVTRCFIIADREALLRNEPEIDHGLCLLRHGGLGSIRLSRPGGSRVEGAVTRSTEMRSINAVIAEGMPDRRQRHAKKIVWTAEFA